MFGKRPKPGGKGLRCKVLIAPSGKPSYMCDRPARRYACVKRSYDLGTIDFCLNHHALHVKQGIDMVLIDRRKK